MSRTWQQRAAIAFGVAVGTATVAMSPPGKRYEAGVARWLEFRARTALHRDPPVSDHLKVLVMDDATVAMLGAPDLSLARWSTLLAALDRQHPKVIVFDKIFGLQGGTDQEAAAFVKATKALGVKVIAGAFYVDEMLTARTPLVPEQEDYRLPARVDWLPVVPHFIYGPVPKVAPAFAHIGHLAHAGGGQIEALVRTRPEFAVPHVSLFTAERWTIDDRGLIVNGGGVGLSADGLLQANLVRPATLHRESLKDLLEASAAGQPLSQVGTDDVVLILANGFTGNTDFKDTPIGTIAGGYVLAAVLNSVLTGHWLDHPPLPLVATLLGLLLGVAGGFLAGSIPSRFGLPLAVAVPGLIVIAGLGTFAYADLMLPWLWASAGCVATTALLFLDRYRQAEVRTARLTAALGRSLPGDRLEELLKNPDVLQAEPTERIISIMFLDIVGFSLASERQTPKEIFKELKAIFQDLRRVIYAHGGVVDRSLGDGLLCFFGYDYRSDAAKGSGESANHAAQAVACATAIQEWSLASCIAAHQAGRPIYPLRVGINTAVAYIGDLGDEQTMDFTIIGHGVNFAKRLEEACELFKTMISESTRNLLDPTASRSALRARYMQMKHHQELFAAYEVDPFGEVDASVAKDLQMARKAYNEFQGIARSGERYLVPDAHAIPVTIADDPGAKGRLLDFSESGLQVALPRFYARGVELSIALEGVELPPFLCDVKWGRANGDVFLHGLRFKNASREASEKCFQAIRDHVEGLKGGPKAQRRA